MSFRNILELRVIIFLPLHGCVFSTGNATTGLHIPGRGGGPALAGFDAGDNVHYFKLPGSKTNDVLHLTQVGNTDTPGLWIFRITKPEGKS